jgi:hypothetical protein
MRSELLAGIPSVLGEAFYFKYAQGMDSSEIDGFFSRISRLS